MKDSTDPELPIDRPALKLGSVFNMALAILGPGVLSVPYALSKGGLGLGGLMIIGLALLNTCTIEALMTCAERLPRQERTFSGIANACFGKKMAAFVDVNVAVYLTGCVCGNLVAISTLGARFVHWLGWHALSSDAVLLACSVLLLPPCLCKDLTRYGTVVSPLGVVALFSVVCCIAGLFFRGQDHSEMKAINASDELLFAFPIATFSFSAQPYIFSLFYEDDQRTSRSSFSRSIADSLTEEEACVESIPEPLLPGPTPINAQDKLTVRAAMALSMAVYTGVGVFGVLQFGVSSQCAVLL